MTPDETRVISRMISLLDVSRSGYYRLFAARAADPSPAAVLRAGLDVKVAKFPRASDEVYGSPRILADLREDGETGSRETVAASMRRQRLQGISPRKFTPVTTVVDDDRTNPADLVDRTWDTGVLDRVWTSDITYLATGQGWVYLCAVRDGCSRRVIGWAVADHLRTSLVTDALNMAVAFRDQRPPTVIFHADRGCQFTSTQMAEYADLHGLAGSVGPTGVCWDNRSDIGMSRHFEYQSCRTANAGSTLAGALTDPIEDCQGLLAGRPSPGDAVEDNRTWK